jgi:hypothetical protein
MITTLAARRTGTMVIAVGAAIGCVLQLTAVFAAIFPFRGTTRYDLGDVFLVSMLVATIVPTVRCARALRCQTAERGWMFHDVPEPILVLAVIGVVLAFYPGLVESVLGDHTRPVLLGVVWFAPMTVLTFFAVGGDVEIENDGGKPKPFVVTVLYHLGGCFGVWFARLVFKDSPAFKNYPAGVPRLVGALMSLVAILVFFSLERTPSKEATRHTLVNPFETVGQPK